MSSTELAHPAQPHWPSNEFHLDLAPAAAQLLDASVPADHYEILRIGPQADEDTLERVHETLSRRFHPDNPVTGDPESYQRVQEAYEILSNPRKRALYNSLRQDLRAKARVCLRGRDFFEGVRGEQNRRLATLCLLYRQRIGDYEFPGLSLLDLEQLTGYTREELGSSLWYLCEKRLAQLGEDSQYSITAEGFDFVETKLEGRIEFLALATIRYYGAPRQREALETRLDALPAAH